MADYSFRIVGLTAPTQPAYIQSVRPALAVENTGVNPLILSGNFSVYQSQRPGALIFQTGLIQTTVAPHSTAILLGQLYWLPPAAGTYNVAAHVTANRRNLFHDFGPLALIVTKEEPPEPPIVTAHATQHETGGADEVNVTNLRGECSDPQPPKDHAGRHEQGGADEMNVNGLKGQLADAQPVSVHGNEAHSEPFATEVALTNHRNNTTAHALATNLEKTANKAQAHGYPSLGADKLIPDAQLPGSLERTNNKGATNGYASLDAGTKVPAAQLGGTATPGIAFLANDQSWKQNTTLTFESAQPYLPTELNRGQSYTLGSATFPVGSLSTGVKVKVKASLQFRCALPAAPTLKLIITEVGGATGDRCNLTGPLILALFPNFTTYTYEVDILITPKEYTRLVNYGILSATPPVAGPPQSLWGADSWSGFYPEAAYIIAVRCDIPDISDAYGLLQYCDILLQGKPE
jgi:hypothetical protein